MSGRLKDKVAVIAGAGPGIGRASAMLFADEGASVAVIARGKETGEETVAKVKERGGKAIFIQADLTQEAQVSLAFNQIGEKFGKIDALFCNAGSYAASSVKDMTEANWDAMFDANLKTYFLSVRAGLPHLAKSGKGSIILTGAIFGYSSNPKNMAHYNASKAGVVALTKTLALELAGQNIRVNCLCPGQVTHHMHSADNASLTTDVKLLRAGLPEDAAFAAVYFASDESCWVTGTTLVIDGGASAGVFPKAGS